MDYPLLYLFIPINIVIIIKGFKYPLLVRTNIFYVNY